MKLSLFFSITLILFSSPGYSQTWQDTVKLIEKAFDRYTANSPGCQLAISRRGQLLFSRAWGMADLEHQVMLNNESIIEAGSVSKQFTAACILLLEQEGKLSLNDDVRKYIPEIPDYGHTITLRHMMQHTSGLKDWGSIAVVSGWPRSTKTYNNDDALYIISKQKTLNHKPGDEYIYSNSNYNLFAIIVERVSGKSLADFSRIHLFEPAGMTHTQWRNNYKKVVANRAIAYGRSGSEYQADMPNEYVYGNGGLLTTAEDLVKWNNYYLNGKLGNPSLLQKQLVTGTFNNGKMGTYAAGLRVDEERGWKTISHTGATAGYRASLEYFPETGLTIAWLSNSAEFDSRPGVADAVRDIFLVNKSPVVAEPARNTYQMTAAQLQSFAGWYREPKSASGIKLLVKDGKLSESRGGHLEPLGENIFAFRNGRVAFQPGRPRQIYLINQTDSLLWIETDSAYTDPKLLQEYAGNFYSDETESGFSVSIKDEKILLYRGPKFVSVLTPLYRDGFMLQGGTLFFERDSHKKIRAFQVNVGRARNIVFVKK